ncbi:MAG: hypothetical protein N2383_14330 [Caldilineales bacterium]|nr:hypothetical protein [Caldilineales bacterium]
MKAINLSQAVRFFDPKQALKGQYLRTWFVERAGSPRRRLAHFLQPHRPCKVLFVGHRGTGKSTELNKLAEEIQDRFHTIGFDALTVIGRSNMRYEDLMLALATQVTRRCIDDGLIGRPAAEPLREGWQALADWWRQMVAGFSLKAARELSTIATLSTLLGEIEIGVSQSAFTREQMNELVDRQMPDLVRWLNWVIAEAERHLNPKSLLLVVEGLDKVDLEAARHLFRDRAATITALNVSTIYTFPLSLRYSPDYQAVQRHFDQHVLLPNLRLRHADGSDDREGQEALRRLVLNRLNEDLIHPEALALLIMASGGIAVDLVKLVNQAALFALERSDTAQRIEVGDAQNAIKELRRELAANLSLAEWRLLKARHGDRRLTNEPAIETLLYKGALIEYSNDPSWCDVHPMLWGLLERYGEDENGEPHAGDR